MRRFSKTEIGVVIGVLVLLVTFNSYWRVKEAGRRAKFAADREAAMRDAAADAVTE